MKRVCILVPENSVIEAIADPHYIFRAANQFLKAQGQTELFDIKLVGLRKDVHLHDNLFTVHAHELINDVHETDLVIIPAMYGDMQVALYQNKGFIPWIIQQHQSGAEIASLCVGAFLLAATGLLNGKKCSTHWQSAAQFRQLFPEVELVDGSIITEEGRIYSSGGANSYWNLLLHLLEKYTNRETAVLAAKYFAIDIDRNNQNAFILFQGQKDHNDTEILNTQQYIEANYREKISVDHLAEIVNIGRRSFERRFKKATNNSAVEYIQRIKVEAAKKSFENTRKNISEVMFDVGYTDTKAFRDVFKRITGLTPVEYRNKYRKT